VPLDAADRKVWAAMGANPVTCVLTREGIKVVAQAARSLQAGRGPNPGLFRCTSRTCLGEAALPTSTDAKLFTPRLSRTIGSTAGRRAATRARMRRAGE
jgi:hypothetical protein